MAEREVLRNKPLVEAIFEVRWRLKEVQPGIFVDEDFHLIPGLLFERLREHYPEYRALPAAELPPEIGGQFPRFQFKSKGDKWPLVQVGPGIVTLNDTENYVWDDFIVRIENLLEQLFDINNTIGHALDIERLTLRYIDALGFDYRNEDVFTYLKEKLKIQVGITSTVFSDMAVSPFPARLALELTYNSSDPIGAITISFITAQRTVSEGNAEPVLIWNSVFQSELQNSMKREEIMHWVNGGHALINRWFFTLIEGDLLHQFRE